MMREILYSHLLNVKKIGDRRFRPNKNPSAKSVSNVIDRVKTLLINHKKYVKIH